MGKLNKKNNQDITQQKQILRAIIFDLPDNIIVVCNEWATSHAIEFNKLCAKAKRERKRVAKVQGFKWDANTWILYLQSETIVDMIKPWSVTYLKVKPMSPEMGAVIGNQPDDAA